MTNESNQQARCPRSYPLYEDDEIHLADYLRILWKWKWVIVAGTLICVVIAAVISLQMPRIYEVSVSIEPGIEGDKDAADFAYIESAESISEKIRKGVYDSRIKEALGLDPLKAEIGFTPTIVPETGTVRVISQWSEGETDLGKKGTRQLIQFLSDDLGKIIERKKKEYGRQIELKQNNIKDAQKERQLYQVILEDTRQQKRGLLKEIEDVKENTKQLMQQRGELLKDKYTDKDISLVFYSSLIQGNRVHVNQMENQVYTLGVEEKKIEGEDYEQSRIIDYARAEIYELSAKKGRFRNIAIIEEPEVSSQPVKPNKKQIVLLAGFSSLFMFIFLAFFIEYIKKETKKSP